MITEDRPSKLTRKMKFLRRITKIKEWMMEDQASIGLGGPPNNWRYRTVWPTNNAGDTGINHYDIRFNNDASEIWIGCTFDDSGDFQWRFYSTATVFRQFALWYLWRWAVGEWFGLRRKLFYWDLSRSVRNLHSSDPEFRRKRIQ